MTPLAWSGDERLHTATVAGSRWLAHVQLWRPRELDRLTTGDVETAVVLLSGTFDLIGGGTAWPARGARSTPFEGRPMAVFLPKQTDLRAERGQGEILLVAARQPAPPPPTEARGVFGKSPLLQLAGSGKAFDPNTGEWRPAETFATSPESLPPRRMERLAVGAVTVERVLAPDYKASTLSLDEVVLAAGASLRIDDIPGRARADEMLVFVRTAASARLQHGGTETTVRGDAAFSITTANDVTDLTIAADGGPAYVLLAYAGKA